jgi:hypothetical protein
MGMLSEEDFSNLDQERFGPQDIATNLASVPELFPFLQRHGEMLNRSRPAVVFAIALTIQAFANAAEGQARTVPPGLFDTLWERFAVGGYGREISSLVQRLEPHAWSFFTGLMETAVNREQWSQKEMAGAGLVYGTVLLALIVSFWPEDRLGEVEELMGDLGLRGSDSSS